MCWLKTIFLIYFPIIAIMENLGILGNSIFAKSTQCMAVYDSNLQVFKEMNQVMTLKLGKTEIKVIKVLCEEESDIYVQMEGIPCHMRVVYSLVEKIYIVEIFLAHTKKWNQQSDIVTLTDLTSDGVWEWFPTVDFEYMSQRFWDILGYNQKDMEESPRAWMDFINEDDKKKCIDMYDNHIKNRGATPYHQTVRYIHRMGHEVHIMCRGSVVDWMPDGQPWRMLGTHTDVTDIVKKDAIEAQSNFISRMSHEIRSPICTILNECELLGNGMKTKVISQTCQQLISLTDNILAVGSIKKNETVGAIQEPGEPAVILGNCIKRHRVAAKKKGIRLKMSMGDLPELVLIDEVKFNQVMDNLLNNAVKYSNSGDIVVDCEYDDDTCVCEIRVIDKGRGIPSNFQPRVFDEFVQGNKTMEGAGLGLFISRKLSKVMGGNLIVEKSEVGSGTTFLFTSVLPKAQLEENNNNNLNVMIVDDMEVNRIIINRRLNCIQKIGFELGTVVEAVDGQDAIQKFKENGGDFQLILMDCLMPVIDGFQATMAIHDECVKLDIEAVPIVAVTASVSPDVHKKCISHGMDYVVTKPYSEQDLLLSIQSCVKSFKK